MLNGGQWLSQTRKMNNHYQSGGGMKGHPWYDLTMENIPNYDFRYEFSAGQTVHLVIPPFLAAPDAELYLDMECPGNAYWESTRHGDYWLPTGDYSRTTYKIYRPIGSVNLLAGSNYGRFHSIYNGNNIYYGIICIDRKPVSFGRTLKTKDNYNWAVGYSGSLREAARGMTINYNASTDDDKYWADNYLLLNNGKITGNALVPYVRRFAYYFAYSKNPAEIPEWMKEGQDIDFQYVTKGTWFDVLNPNPTYDNKPGEFQNAGISAVFGCSATWEILAALEKYNYSNWKYLLGGVDPNIAEYEHVHGKLLSIMTTVPNSYDPNFTSTKQWFYSPWDSLVYYGNGIATKGELEGMEGITPFINTPNHSNPYRKALVRDPVVDDHLGSVKVESPTFGYKKDTTLPNPRINESTSYDINNGTFKYADAGCPLWVYPDGNDRILSPGCIYGNKSSTPSSGFGDNSIGLGSFIMGRYLGRYLHHAVMPIVEPEYDNLKNGKAMVFIDNHIDDLKIVGDFVFVEQEA